MTGTAPGNRLEHLDHLRAALVMLVVVHHLALVYGASAPFYYVEPPFDEPATFVLLTDFVLFNQAWFMGLLFAVAGYFTPGSVDRRGPGAFARARLVRLGLPAMAFIFVLNPLASIGFFLMPASLTGITAPPAWTAYFGLWGLGPLWFAVLLLAFDLGYAAVRTGTGRREGRAGGPSPAALVAGAVIVAIVLAGASYLMRMEVPLGRKVTLLVDWLDFPTLAYLPQYLGFFLLGLAAARRGWLDALPAGLAWAGAGTAVLAWIFLFPLAVSGEMFSLAFLDPPPFVGGGTWQSAVYALWDSVTAVGLLLALPVLFRRAFAGPSHLGRFLADQGFAVYVLHCPVIVFVAYGLRAVDLPALVKMGLAAVITLPLCFTLAWLARRIPGVARVL